MVTNSAVKVCALLTAIAAALGVLIPSDSSSAALTSGGLATERNSPNAFPVMAGDTIADRVLGQIERVCPDQWQGGEHRDRSTGPLLDYVQQRRGQRVKGSECVMELENKYSQGHYVLTAIDHFTVDQNGKVTRFVVYLRPGAPLPNLNDIGK
jgi:hypothetical protein